MKKKIINIIIIIIITIFCVIVSIIAKNNYNFENPDELYIKMKEINDSQSLKGLSQEELIELLGEPEYEYVNKNNKKVYEFNAGKIIKKSFLGNMDGQKCYEFRVIFDEYNRVEATYIRPST